ncbi:MAG: hypothetical protein SF097_10775 [Acidobacteriota bacterium]|nr:hypothetical protein [Acidobacteriota bacterium]
MKQDFQDFFQDEQVSNHRHLAGIDDPVNPAANLVHPVKKECPKVGCSDLAKWAKGESSNGYF